MELTAVTEDFDKKFSAAALHLLNESEELFIGQFLQFENGEIIVKFNASGAFPRKGEYVQAMYLPAKLQDYRNWGNITYEYLFKNRLKGTEAVCVWQSKSKEDGFVILGFRGIDLEFADYIAKAPGALIIMGPQRPPIDYLANLYRLSKDEHSGRVSEILDYPYTSVLNNPILIREDSPSSFVYQHIQSSRITILQGPPGTGKTHLISELCEKLCAEGKSVLVTALTNRALIEVASKPAVEKLLENGKVTKTNLTADERDEIPKLLSLKQIVPIKGGIVLSTYYIVSGFAADLAGDGAFDVVIMDEASQALLPMFAAANKIGHTNLWVGDTAQLGPVVALNEDRISSNEFETFVDGLTTVSGKRNFPIYQLTHTHRLTKRNADYTGIFYRNSLESSRIESNLKLTSLNKILHQNGGPTLVLTDMNVSEAAPEFAMDMATLIVYSILKEKPSTSIAVLTCLRKTTRALQKSVAVRMGIGNKVLIDTIARVQGLTTDITLLFIPNTSLLRSLEPRLFNVATSRAREHTIIIADKNILNFGGIDRNVENFLKRLKDEKCIYVPSKNGGNRLLEPIKLD